MKEEETHVERDKGQTDCGTDREKWAMERKACRGKKARQKRIERMIDAKREV